jgi:hypothetical protein
VENRNTSTFLLPLIALLAILYPVATTLRSPSQGNSRPDKAVSAKSQTSAKDRSRIEPAHDALGFVRDYFGPDHDAASEYTIEFLTVLVPDPIDSRLPYLFDSFIDSIQRAAGAAGYVLDRFDFPWAEGKVAGETGGENPPERRFETQPGRLLFRDPGHRRLLLMFLVGETATTGIHKAALLSALDQMAPFYGWEEPHGHEAAPLPQPERTRRRRIAAKDTIRILGPSFSGSAVSLQLAINGWLAAKSNLTQHRDVGFDIVSGTATVIRKDRNTLWFPGLENKASFYATVPQIPRATSALVSYLLGTDSRGIAILTEGGTAYGEYLGRNREKTRYLILPFPLHISWLRKASETAKQSREESASDLGVKPSAQASLYQEERADPRETIPSFSAANVSSAELVLSNLLSTISRGDYRYVGILATDVQDSIFLSQEVHAHCPGTVIFTYSPDLRFTHPDASSSTLGTLIITPYPLFNLNQLWTFPFQGDTSRLQFPSQAAEGVYNAALALLGQEGKMIEYGHPFLLEDKSETTRPPLWVTVVGRKGMLPLTLLDWSDSEDEGYILPALKTDRNKRDGSMRDDPTKAMARGLYTDQGDIVMFVVSLGLGGLSLLILKQYTPARFAKPNRTSWISHALGDTVTSRYRFECRLLLFAGTASLLAFYLVFVSAFLLAAVAAVRLRIAGEQGVKVSLLGVLGGMVLVLLAWALARLASSFRAIAREEHRVKSEISLAIKFSCLATLLCAAALVISWYASAWKKPADAVFTYLRAFSLDSGLSPLVPLVYVTLAAFSWAFCSHRRLRLVDGLELSDLPEKESRCPGFLDLNTPSFTGVMDLERKTKEYLTDPAVMSSAAYAAVFTLAFGIGGYFFYSRLAHSYESPAFFWLFGVAFFIVYWALLMDYVRLMQVWFSLRQLLRRLGWHPMRGAYERYRKSFPNLPRFNLAVPLPSFTVLESSVDQAEKLLGLAKALLRKSAGNGVLTQKLWKWVSGAEPHILEASRKLSEALKAASDLAGEGRTEMDWGKALELRGRCQCELSRILRSLETLLEPYWKSGEADFHGIDLTAEERQFFLLGEEFIAGRVAHFLTYMLSGLRKLGAMILAGLLLMLLAVTSYAFQPRDQFLLFNWIVVLSFTGMVWIIFVQMDRDFVLSSLSNTVPGQVTWNRELVLRILIYVVLPILALLGAQFPETFGQVTSLLGALQGAHH